MTSVLIVFFAANEKNEYDEKKRKKEIPTRQRRGSVTIRYAMATKQLTKKNQNRISTGQGQDSSNSDESTQRIRLIGHLQYSH